MKTDRAAALNDEDFFAWTRSQARELRRFARTRPNVALDVEHIAQEIADLGTERRDALRSWTARIIGHLLLEHSPAQEPRRGWIHEVVNVRSEIERRLSGTLQRDLKRRLPLLYAEARRNVRRKLERYGEAEIADRLPEQCLFTRAGARGLLAAFEVMNQAYRPAPANTPKLRRAA
jgi:hypothetical protein